jgi:hypothetical protein
LNSDSLTESLERTKRFERGRLVVVRERAHKIEGAIPNGFEITEKLQTYRVEGCNVNMKGRRLEQLKGEDVKLSLSRSIRARSP